jgi:hypothetical protein
LELSVAGFASRSSLISGDEFAGGFTDR